MRIDRQQYFMQLAELTAKRGTCDRLKVGAVLVKGNRVVATGYNGSPPGLAHCDDVGHLIINGHCERTVHAEQNAIATAAKFGISLYGATMYITHEPCFTCKKLIISAGIEHVLYKHAYVDKRTPKEYEKALDCKWLATKYYEDNDNKKYEE